MLLCVSRGANSYWEIKRYWQPWKPSIKNHFFYTFNAFQCLSVIVNTFQKFSMVVNALIDCSIVVRPRDTAYFKWILRVQISSSLFVPCNLVSIFEHFIRICHINQSRSQTRAYSLSPVFLLFWFHFASVFFFFSFSREWTTRTTKHRKH